MAADRRLFGVLAVLLALASSPAFAAEKRIGLIPFTGPGASAVQRATVKALAARRFRVMELDSGASPGARNEADAARAIAADQSLMAVLSGTVKKKGRKLVASLILRDGNDGQVIGQDAWSGRSAAALAKAVQKEIWPSFKDALGELQPREGRPESADPVPPPPPPPPPLARPATETPDSEPVSRPPVSEVRRRPPPVEEEAEEKEAPATPMAYGPMPIEVYVGPRFSTRGLKYRNVPEKPLAEFQTDRPSAAVGFGAAWFPLLGTPRVGVTVDGQFGARMRATTADDHTYDLQTYEVMGGAAAGITTGPLALDLNVGGGVHQANFNGTTEEAKAVQPIPNVNYTFLRAGLGARLYTSSPFSLMAGGSYRHVFKAGDIAGADWFPNLKVYGLDFMIGAAYRILPWLEARASFDGRYYRYHMNTAIGDPRVAGGAVDLYWGALVGVAGLFGAK
jgi:hypothetical protein